jgi:hypothetical protein
MGADTIVQGAPAAAQPGTEGLILDSKNNILYTFGQSGVPAALASAAAVASTTYTAAGAIAPTGVAVLKTGAASAMTLVAPPTGATLTIVAADAEAYVVTTPANKINGADDTMTFAGAVGDSIQLASSGGVWYVVAKNGVTLTEV